MPTSSLSSASLAPKDITPLTTQIKAYVTPQSGARKLMEGYCKMALDPDAWEAEQAANLPDTKKRKSKSQKQDGDEDESPADEEEEEETEKAGKKRKRASSPVRAKRGGKGKKSKATVESEDDAAEVEREEGGANKKQRPSIVMRADPDALKVREWRHTLQMTFLGKALPKEEEMPTVQWCAFPLFFHFRCPCICLTMLQFSKIGKVMRHIHLLEPGKVPRDDEFKFRDRSGTPFRMRRRRTGRVR
ncbi:hypothetical protein DFH06DRAFT_1359435 [Mycena polygramma]|nr:hypothetical protein DFH06DRAFT_1437194 [Mycena polygramma]KAJ7673329.1 hypothetical protein DFH06DRAFT_1359435 [Mycena polygramma]